MVHWLIDSIATGGVVLFVPDVVAKATLLLCLTAALAGLLRRSAAAVRHRLWTLTLCGLLVLPLLSWLLPGWQLQVFPAANETADALTFPNRANLAISADSSSKPADRRHALTGPGKESRPAARNVSSGQSFRASPIALSHASKWMLLLWPLGFVVVMLPALVGVVGNTWRRRQSRRVVDARWLGLLDELSRLLSLDRPIDLRMSQSPTVPLTWGILRPVVLLPAHAMEWPDQVRRLVLLHELAHVQRGDVGFQLIGRLAAAVYWFHPLAWYALFRLRAECECACDDQVVHLGVRRTDYAQQLVDLTRFFRAERWSAAVPLIRTSTLQQRMQALFDDRRSHRLLGHRGALVMLGCSLIVVAGLALIHPASTAAGQNPGSAPQSLPAAAPAVAKQTTPPAVPNGLMRETYTHPITITGRAVDPAGKPIAGAHVYLASRRADYRRIAETTTNSEGRYAFHDIPLPIERSNTVNGRDDGSFQVFGQAGGFGFAWRPQKWFYPQPKPASITYEPNRFDPPQSYEANDKIVLDLHFSPAAHLAGMIVDDRGHPLSDVRLEIRECVFLREVNNVIEGSRLDALNEHDSAPAAMKFRTTDAAGHFDFTGLPVDCRFWIHVRAQGHPWQSFYAATTDGPQADHDRSPVLTGELKVVLTTSLDVPIKMVCADTGKPAPRVAVQAGAGSVSILETTDEKGRVTLRLPPGTYRMENWPARGTPYLVTEGELVVKSPPPTEPIVMSLRPASILEITVLNAETGAGVPDVDVWQRSGPNGQRERLVFRSWEVATRIARRDSPRTDAHGKLRAFVEPGKHRIGVGWQAYPPGYEVVESDGQDVECRPGQTVPVQFTLRKKR